MLTRTVERALDLVVDEVPGAGILAGLIGDAVAVHRKKKSEDFLAELASRIAGGDAEGAREKIKQHLEQNEWAADQFECALRALQTALCADARKCIAVLVSLSVDAHLELDTKFRRVADFLATATAKELLVARDLCAATLEFLPDGERSRVIVSTPLQGSPLRVCLRSGSRRDPIKSDDNGIIRDVPTDEVSLAGSMKKLSDAGLAREVGTAVDVCMSLVVDGDRLDCEDRMLFDRNEHFDSLQLLAQCLQALS